MRHTGVMRPRRIVRRILARARHWGRPHVHCPSCGSDNPVPEDDQPRTCFTCHIEWFRHPISGDGAADLAAIRARVPDGWPWTATFHPLMLDVPAAAQTKKTVNMECAFVYMRRPEPDRGGQDRGWP